MSKYRKKLIEKDEINLDGHPLLDGVRAKFGDEYCKKQIKALLDDSREHGNNSGMFVSLMGIILIPVGALIGFVICQLLK